MTVPMLMPNGAAGALSLEFGAGLKELIIAPVVGSSAETR